MKARVTPLYSFDTNTHIVSSDVHPTSPWVLTANDGGAIVLWDYQRQAALKQWHSSTLDPGLHSGLIQSVFFYDTPVLRWKWLHPSIPNDIEAFQGIDSRRHWISILCDNKVMLLDYVTWEVTVVRQAAFEERWLTAMEIVDANYFAVGCSDGSIRLYDLTEKKVIKVFPKGAHAKAVTILRTFSQNIRQRPWLLAAGVCGAVTVWNLDTSDDLPAYRLQNSGPSVTSLCLSGHLMQVTGICTDHSITMWSLMNGQELWKGKGLKDSKKHSALGVTYFRSGVNGGEMILVHTKGTQVYTLDVPHPSAKPSSSLHPFLDFSPFLPDLCPVTDLKLHPLHPNLFFILTGSSLSILSNDHYSLPPAIYSDAFHTTLSPTQVQMASDHRGSLTGVESNCYFYCMWEGFLCSMTVKLASEGVSSRICKLTSSGKQMLQPPFTLTLSPSNHYLVLHSKSSGYYEIFRLPESPSPLSLPTRLKSGSAKELVWHRTKDRFAVLSPVTEDGSVGSFAGKYVGLVLIVYEVNREGQVFMLCREEGLEAVERVLPGSLLGVVQADKLTFWSWDTMRDCNIRLPAPEFLSWSDSYLCLCYSHEFYLYSLLSDSFSLLFRLREAVLSVTWLHGVLFYVTHTDIKWLHPGLSCSYTLISHNYPIDYELKLTLQPSKPLHRKPIGSLTLLGIVEGTLLVLDSMYTVHSYPLNTPLLRFALMLEGHMEEEAMRLAYSFDSQLRRECVRILTQKSMGKAALSLLTDELVTDFVPAPGIPIPGNRLFSPELVFLQCLYASDHPEYLKSLQYQFVEKGDYEAALAVAAVQNNPTNTLKLLMLGRKLGRAWALAAAMGNET